MLEPMQLALGDAEPVPAPRGSLCRPLPSAAACQAQPPLHPLSRKLLLPISALYLRGITGWAVFMFDLFAPRHVCAALSNRPMKPQPVLSVSGHWSISRDAFPLSTANILAASDFWLR